VNQLRQLMLEELQRRNFAASTIRTYLHGVTHFSRYFRRPPDQLGPEDIRKYQAMLFTKLKYSPNTVIVRLSSLRFFYIHVLKRNWSIAETPYPKKLRHLPGVLSQEEVARLIEAADTPFHRMLLMTMYATGARRAEAAHLKVSDIDSQRMVVPWLRWLAVSALSQKRSKARPRCIYAPADQNAVRLMNAALASNLLDRADEVLLIPAGYFDPEIEGSRKYFYPDHAFDRGDGRFEFLRVCSCDQLYIDVCLHHETKLP
jgi:site-specific recombinase XerD